MGTTWFSPGESGLVSRGSQGLRSPLESRRGSRRVTCGSPGQLQGRSIFTQDLRLCLDETLSLDCFGLSLLMVALGLAVPMLHHLCGWDLWYCFHLCLAHLPRRRWQRGEDTLLYDAFVVFDKVQSAVADWVYNELRVQLEERRGRRALRLCLEERDWLPGKTLFENLWASVYSSRKTVFVLDHTDRVSGLLRASFLLAQQRLLEDRKDVVVLVILRPAAYRSRYVRLRQRLCRQSVLLWPHQPSGQGSFWANLGIALTRDEEWNSACLSSCSWGFRPLVKLCVESAGFSRRCMSLSQV